MMRHKHALLIHIGVGATQEDASLEEFSELAKSSGLDLTHLKRIRKKGKGTISK